MQTCEIYEMWRPRLKSFSHSLFRHSQRTPPQRVCVCRNSRQTAIALWQFDYFMSKWKTLRSLFCRMFFVDFFSFFFVCPFMNFISNQQSDEQTKPWIGGGPSMDVFADDKKYFLCGQKVKNATFRRTFFHHSLCGPILYCYPSPFSLPRATQRVRTFICESANNINTYI